MKFEELLNMNFSQLAEEVLNMSTPSEANGYKLNLKGEKALKQFNDIISKLQDNIVPVIQSYVTDIDKFKKEIAMQIVSTINSNNIATEEFDIMSKLDTLTNGGQSIIDSNRFVFNNDDKILDYLEKV